MKDPAAPTHDPAIGEGLALDDLAIEVTADHPREFIFTDKGAAHLAGEAATPDTRSYHGFYVAMHELMDGWSLRLGESTAIDNESIERAVVRPDKLVRFHQLPGGGEITETVTLLDRSNAFSIVYDNVPPGPFVFEPRLDMRFLWETVKPSYMVRWQNGVLVAAREDEVGRADELDHPAYLAITVTGGDGFHGTDRYIEKTYPKDAARKAMGTATPYLPGEIRGRIPGRVTQAKIKVFVAAGASTEEAVNQVAHLRRDHQRKIEAREARLTALIRESSVVTGNPDHDRALAWARISLDNLIMNQRGLGIYAGFYWFTTYWGRDSFIVLPGASLVQGDWETAEKVLSSFAEFQQKDMSHPRAGRLPNFVTVEQVQFAGIDGTWWFVRALDELWRRSGRDDFARKMTPVVLRAVEGALAQAVDEHGFLTHGDGETWMDAGGEAHPYSPRGSRAVEIQALFYRGLLTAARLAETFPDVADKTLADLGVAEEAGGDIAGLYRAQADRLAASFVNRYWQLGRLVDHLNIDGSTDLQIRPNSLLALLVAPDLLDEEQRRRVTDEAAEELVRPWGVLSLEEADPDFLPKHLDLADHYYDKAYHNGDVWLWLSGPYISALDDPCEGFGQTQMLIDEILATGAVGTIQEIRDGARAENNDEFGGATSQAWSLSELLRTIYDDYLGLKVDLSADPPRIEITPRIPEAWPMLDAPVRLGDVRGRIAVTSDEIRVSLEQAIPADWEVTVTLGGADSANINGPMFQRGDDDTFVLVWPAK